MGSDEFIALFFFEGKLIEKLNYTVTLADAGGATGSCEKFIKMGNYREPNKVIEIRMRWKNPSSAKSPDLAEHINQARTIYLF